MDMMPEEPGLLHVPPVAGSNNEVVAPTHTPLAPVMGETPLTVKVLVAGQLPSE